MRAFWKGGVATIAAAALMVVGLDYVTFAATGDSLILGRANSADRTTTITKDAPGAVLSLQSDGDDLPSLRVSSPARVVSLNADMLDGRHASQLATNTTTFRAGARGEVMTEGFGAWSLPVDPGLYEVSFTALLEPESEQDPTGISAICGIIDLSTGGERPRIYTAASGVFTSDLPLAASGAASIRVRPGQAPGLICVSNNTLFSLFKPAVASLTPINTRSVEIAEPANPLGGQRSFR